MSLTFIFFALSVSSTVENEKCDEGSVLFLSRSVLKHVEKQRTVVQQRHPRSVRWILSETTFCIFSCAAGSVRPGSVGVVKRPSFGWIPLYRGSRGVGEASNGSFFIGKLFRTGQRICSVIQCIVTVRC